MNRFVCSTALLLAATGCLSHGAMQTASTLGKGNFAGGFEVNVDALVYTGAGSGTSGVGNLTYPKFNGHFRFGITDNFDIGIRAGSTLFELQTKIMFTSPDSDLFVLSLAPALSGYFIGLGSTSIGVINVPVPLLIGFKFGDHELVVGPRLVNQIAFVGVSSGSGVGYGLSVGGSVGFAIRLGDGFILMPELSTSVPLFVTAATSGGNAGVFAANQFFFSFGIGGTFGRFKPRGGVRAAPPAPPADDDMTPPPPPPPAPSDVPPPPPPPPP